MFTRLFFIGIFAIVSTLGLKMAQAYVVHEVEPGILEMKAIQDTGLEIKNIYIDKKGRWAYFEVSDPRPLSRFPTSLLQPNKSETRYFYAPVGEARLTKTKRLRLLQYGIGKRVYNSRGKIPFGSQRFFYPMVYFQTVS